MSPRLPLLSVFIPAFNAGRFIREAIESVLDNGFGDLELIVVDDGSVDDTASVAEAIRHPALRVVRHPKNLGIGLTRELGLGMLRGRYLALLDADDIAVRGRFEAQVGCMEQASGPDILGGAVEQFGDRTGIVQCATGDEDIRTTLLFNSALFNPAVCMRLASVRAAGLHYSAEADAACDYMLWAEALRAGLRFANLAQVVTRYRRHGAAMTATARDVMAVHTRAARRVVAAALFPRLDARACDALADAISGRLPDAARWRAGVHALSLAAGAAGEVPRINATMMLQYLEFVLLGAIRGALESGLADANQLERLTDEDEAFAGWRAADGGSLDGRIVALYA